MTDSQFMAAVIRDVQARGYSAFEINRARVLRKKEEGMTADKVADEEVRNARWKRLNVFE